MSTWTWILIAIAVAAGFVALTPRKSKNQVNDPESAQGTAPGTDRIANSGTDSEYRSSNSVLRSLPDTQTGQDPVRYATVGSDVGIDGQPHAQLMESHEMQRILGQWKDIQADFVDGPRKAVQDADALVAEVMQQMAQTFAGEREQLESQWAGGDDVSTEDLRRCFRLYRAFFERLVAA